MTKVEIKALIKAVKTELKNDRLDLLRAESEAARERGFREGMNVALTVLQGMLEDNFQKEGE